MENIINNKTNKEKLFILPQAGEADFTKAKNDIVWAQKIWHEVLEDQEWQKGTIDNLENSLFEDKAIAETYDDDPFTNFMFQEENQDILEMLDIQQWDKVLDIGCGTGKYIEWIQKYKPVSITGIDISQAMIDQAKKKYTDNQEIEFKQADIENWLPFPDNSFDKINCAHVLKFITTQSALNQVFKEINRILKPWGSFVFSNNHPERDFDRENFSLKTKENETEEWETPEMKLHTMQDYVQASKYASLENTDTRDVCISKHTAELFEPESFKKVIWWKVIIAMKFKKPT